jgi:DNA primase
MEVIRNKLPRVEAVIMAEGIQLRDCGSYYQGLCPFHEDKSPSFTVYKDTQKYHCFGCNVWGDVVGFIMRLHDKTFKQALAYLNIRDYKSSWRKPKASMIDMIVAEEKQGIDVKAKYGDEFIQTLLAKEIIKLSNPINNLHNIVKVNKNDQVLADKLIALANSAVDTIIYDE